MASTVLTRQVPRADELLDEYPLPEYLRSNVRPGLTRLLEAIENAADFNEAGFARALHNVHDDLRRLKAISDDRLRYPEIAQVEIKQPMFILGLPRCGTSVLHALIGCDKDVRTPLQWEIANPSPPPETATFASDPRIEQFEAHQRAQFGGQYDELKKGHPIGPLIPQECGSFMTSSFQSSNVCMMSRLPGFYDWFLGIDATFRYEVHKMWLQHLSWKNPRKHWVLKIQEHMYKMGELRAVYPDAIFVQPHRDPTTVIASISQLIRVIREPAYDQQDSHKLGREFLHLWHDGLERMIAYRHAHPDLPIYDMRYKDLIADPVGTVRALYSHYGWTFTQETADAMLQWLADNPADKHGKRKYSLEEFGLTADDVRAVYTDYIDEYHDHI